MAPNSAARPMGLYAKSSTSTTTTIAPLTDPIGAYQSDKGSMRFITTQIGAANLWATGVTGAGVDIAVVDTGVAPVQGLAGKIVNGPDISLDSPYSHALGLDAFGHGTHVASIAAGVDPGTTNLTDPTKFVGVAPGARIVNVKVGAFDGATDVSQVIAGIDWVVQHKRDNGLNIKVLNLSYGAASTLATADDPLSWAAEVAWRNGITVVAAAGNEGTNSMVTSPANNPLILAAGAVDQTVGTLTAASFSAAAGPRQPDLWGPGAHVLGLDVPNSFVDARYPSARAGTRLFRGSGTSQSAAVVSGAIALLASANPTASPDQLKAALVASGRNAVGQVDVVRVDTAQKALAAGKYPPVVLPAPVGNGAGAIESVRGGVHLQFNGVVLQGEKDIFGAPWNGAGSANSAYALTSWQGGTFNGNTWAGASWAGASWAGASWAGASWAGASWAGASWAGASWAGASWAGKGWLSHGWR